VKTMVDLTPIDSGAIRRSSPSGTPVRNADHRRHRALLHDPFYFNTADQEMIDLFVRTSRRHRQSACART